jgi:hypothetical protein
MVVTALCVAVGVSAGRVAAQDRDLAVTVYSNGPGLIRDMRTMELAKGRSSLSLSRIASQIDPTSVRVRSLTAPDRVAVLEQRFHHDAITGEGILARYLNQEVELTVEGSDIPVKGRLLHVGGDVTLMREEGRIDIIRRDTIRRFSVPALPDGLTPEPTLAWLVDNTGSAGMHRLETAYLTQGMAWHAEYAAVIGENDQSMLFSGWASIDNRSGMTYDNATVTLVAGDINRVMPPQPVMMRERAMLEAKAMDMMAAPQFAEQPLFEYHAYTLERRATLHDNGTVQLALLPDTRTQVTRQYVYDGGMRPEGVQTRVRLENKKEKGLGKAIPRGVVRLYQEDAQGGRQLIGEDQMKDLAPEETAYLTVGRAFDIVGERTQTDARGLSNRSREESYQIVLRNHKKERVSVRVVEHLSGPTWTISQSSQKYEKLNAQTIEFDVPVPPEGEATVTYSVVYRW